MDSKIWFQKLQIIFYLTLFHFMTGMTPASAQNQSQSQQEDAFYEMYLEDLLDENEDQDLSEFLNHIDELRKKPLNLNSMKAEDFKALIFLNAQQVNNFFQYKSKYGNLQHLHELQAIAGFDLKTIKRLAPLVYINALPGFVGNNSVDNKNALQHDLMLRSSQVIQKSAAYVSNPSVYTGSSTKFWLRYKLNHEYFKLAFLYEKDPGELWNPKYNHRSMSFQLQHLKFINKLIIGDFNLKYGQGLGVWTGFAPQYNNQVGHLAKSDFGLQMSSSSNEYGYLSGMAVEVNLKSNTKLTGFYSIRNLDANLQDLDGQQVQSISVTGLKRTEKEMLQSRNLVQHYYGVNLNSRLKLLDIGFNWSRTKFNIPVSSSNLLYKSFDFSGNELNNMSVYYQLRWSGKTISAFNFGEVGYSQPGSFSQIHGLIIPLNKMLDIGFLWRAYSPAYANFYSAAYAIGENKNENTFSVLINLNWLPKQQLQLRSEIAKFPWIKYRVDAPSSSERVSIQWNAELANKTQIIARFKIQRSILNDLIENGINQLTPVQNTQLRLQIAFPINSKYSMMNRLEFINFRRPMQNQENGYMLFTDITYKSSQKLSYNCRVAYFKTDSYHARIYLSERDVLYQNNLQMLQNQGFRAYFNVKQVLAKNIDLWLRLSNSFYLNQKSVGSLNDEISGSHKTEGKFQLRFKF